MISLFFPNLFAGIAQLGERQTEDLKVPGSIPGHGIFPFLSIRTTSIMVTEFNSGMLISM